MSTDITTLTWVYQTYAIPALAWSALISSLTILAFGVVRADFKESIALWLMGAPTNENWDASFLKLFDAVFGPRIVSIRFLLCSALSSLLAVTVIWVSLGLSGAFSTRIGEPLTLGSTLAVAICINAIADYVSLAETRLLLGLMRQHEGFLVRLVLLIADFLATAAIIWLAIYIFFSSPLYNGDKADFAEVIGVFSVFSVFFYSTFVTSAWAWVYFVSTNLLRGLRRFELTMIFDVEKYPIVILSTLMGAITFIGSMILSFVLEPRDGSVSVADKGLCQIFQGKVCVDVAELTQNERDKYLFIRLVCQGGATDDCLREAISRYKTSASETVELLDLGCNYNDIEACLRLALLVENGIGTHADPNRSLLLYRELCESGEANGCLAAGHLLETANGLERDLPEAVAFYQSGCDLGDPASCSHLALMHHRGLGAERDLDLAIRLYEVACNGNYGMACGNLGHLLYEEHLGSVSPVLIAAAFERGCRFGNGLSCRRLADLIESGFVSQPPIISLEILYQRGCEFLDRASCKRLHGHSQFEETSEIISVSALRLSCDGKVGSACYEIGLAHEFGISGLVKDQNAASEYYVLGCDFGHVRSCVAVGVLGERGYGLVTNIGDIMQIYVDACDQDDGAACTNLVLRQLSNDSRLYSEEELLMLAEKACELGGVQACQIADRLR